MSELLRLRKIYALKKVYRHNTVDDRNESSAEHTWSAIILADYFIDKVEQKIDRLRVFELLLYHDLIEVEVGDIPLHYSKKRIDKSLLEKKAMTKLNKEFPSPTNARFKKLFIEFENKKTIEARFAKAIDRLDAVFHELNHKNGWWLEVGEEKVRELNAGKFDEFPILKESFEEILAYAKRNKFFVNKK